MPATTVNIQSRAQSFVLKLCRMRLYLLKQDKSRNPDPQLHAIATGLQHEFKNVTGNANTRSLLRRHASNIQRIMPGKGCSCFASLNKELTELFDLANEEPCTGGPVCPPLNQ